MKISDFGLSRDVYEEDSYVKRSKVPLMGYATCTCRVMGWGSGRDNKRVQALSPESREPAMSVALWSPQGPQGLTTVPFEGHLLLEKSCLLSGLLLSSLWVSMAPGSLWLIHCSRQWPTFTWRGFQAGVGPPKSRLEPPPTLQKKESTIGPCYN